MVNELDMKDTGSEDGLDLSEDNGNCIYLFLQEQQ